MSDCFDSVESFFQWFVNISNIGRIDLSDLVKVWDGSFKNFCNSYSLVDSSSHGFKDDRVSILFVKDVGSVRNVGSHSSLSSNSDFIFVDWFLLFWFFYSSVFICHVCSICFAKLSYFSR